MAEVQTVTHISLNSRYRIVFEKAAGVKTGNGFKVEVNGDELEEVKENAKHLNEWANDLTQTKEGELK